MRLVSTAALIACSLSAPAIGAGHAGADPPEERYAASKCERHQRLGSDLAPTSVFFCSAVAKTDEYLHALGVELQDTFSIESVEVTADAVGSSHGIADVSTSTIRINHWPGKIAWGLEWIPPIEESFVVHEIVHIAVYQLLREDYFKIARAWHEFLAYAIQFEVMDEALRGRILSRYADVAAVTRLTEVNEFTYGADPERFSVIAHRTYRALGSEAFARSLLALAIKETSAGWYEPPR